MAEGCANVDLTKLQIGDLPEVPLPEIVPLKKKDVQKFLAKYERLLSFVESWVGVLLKILSTHPRTPTPNPEDLVNDWDGMTINQVTEMYVQELEKSRDDLLDDIPVLADDFDEDANVGEMELLDPKPARKVKISFFKRFLKWPKKHFKREKDEDLLDIEELEISRRERAYEPLKLKFIEILDKETRNHEKEKSSKDKISGPKTNTPVHESSEDTKWIDDMTQSIKICHMIFRVSRDLYNKTRDEYDLLKFESHESATHFENQPADMLNRNIYNLTYAKTLSLMALFQVEGDLLERDQFVDCLLRYEQECRREQKKKVGKYELTIVKKMLWRQSVLNVAENSPTQGAAYSKVMKKSPSKRDLVIDTDDDDIFQLDEYPSGKFVISRSDFALELSKSTSGITPDHELLFTQPIALASASAQTSQSGTASQVSSTSSSSMSSQSEKSSEPQASGASQSSQSKQASNPERSTSQKIESSKLRALLESPSVHQTPVITQYTGTNLDLANLDLSNLDLVSRISVRLNQDHSAIEVSVPKAQNVVNLRRSPRKHAAGKGAPLKSPTKPNRGGAEGSTSKSPTKPNRGRAEGSTSKSPTKPNRGGAKGSTSKSPTKPKPGGAKGSTVTSPPKPGGAKGSTVTSPPKPGGAKGSTVTTPSKRGGGKGEKEGTPQKHPRK